MSAWNTPRGIARPAPLEDPHEYLLAWFEIIQLRLEAALATDADAREIRLRSNHRETALFERVAATVNRPPLQLACERLGLTDALADVAILVGFELDERIGALVGELRMATVASVRRDGSCARALDFVERELVTRGLARIDTTSAPARDWTVRADRRWFALAAGRLDVDATLPLRMVATDERVLSHAGARRLTVEVDGDIATNVLVREATILDAAVAFRSPPPRAVTAALTAAGIPMLVGGNDE